MKLRYLAVLLLVLGGLPGAARAQAGYLWTIEELRTRAELIVVAQWVATEDTGRQVDHPDLKPAMPMVEMRAEFKILTVLKKDPPPLSSASGDVLRLKHYRFDQERWQRDHPGVGLVNRGSVLQFGNDRGPYLLFLKRARDAEYEPVSGQTFPTDSVFLLARLGKPRG